MSDLRTSWDDEKLRPVNKGKKEPMPVSDAGKSEVEHGLRAKVFGGSIIAGLGLGLLVQFGSSAIENASSVVPGVGIVPSQVDKPSSRPAPRPVTYLDMIN